MVDEKELNDFLEHFGVKGMQWGVRKEEGTSSGASSSIRTRVSDRNRRINTERKATLTARAAKSDIRISELNVELASTSKHAYEKKYLRQEKAATIASRDKDLKAAKKQKETGLTSTQKKVLIGAGIATAIVGYSVASKYYDSEGARAAIRRGKSQLKYRDSFKHDASLAGKMSPQQVLKNVSKQVNPNYNNLGGQMNCRRCTFAYELRRRGYDVQATPSAFGYGQNESGLVNALIKGDRNILSRSSVSAFASSNPTPSPFGLRTRGADGDTRTYSAIVDSFRPKYSETRARSSRSVEGLRDVLSKHPNGARGEALFDMGGFAHSMQWEIFDGVPHIFDSQKGQHFPVDSNGLAALTDKWGFPSVVEITRLDNVDLDLAFLSRWATNAA